MTARTEVIPTVTAGGAALIAEVLPRRVRIEPAPHWPRVRIREVWASRELVLFLAWRDVKVRYAQTVLGAAWAVLQPVMSMVVFTVIFGRFARIPSDGAPYAAFSLAALVPWTYFSGALGGAANSLIANSNMLTKVYFPRLAIPFAPMLAGLMDFAIAFVVLLVVLIAFGITPSPWSLLVIPCCMLTAMMTALGVGCALAALNIQYRDFRQIAVFLVQVWMYASPIVYPLSMVPARFRVAYSLNPMVGVISGFRAVLLEQGTVPWMTILLGMATSAVLLSVGMMYFRHTERVFADVA
jgi:lipopolysaccharide transport system permease protein